MYKRCEAVHGKGRCEKYLAIVYPKCKSGFFNVGCCICRPSKPNCAKLGMGHQFDLSCAKKVRIGKPYTASCPKGKSNSGGLCYIACNSGYYGVGPVCWANTPKGWVGCGMGAAKDSKTCAKQIFDQVSSIGQVALTIATAGSSAGASGAANAGKNAGKLA